MFWYLLLRLFTFLARHIPERWGIAAARWFGRVVYRISPVAKANRDNARHVLGPNADPTQVSAVARRAFENRLANYYDMLFLSGMPLEQVRSQTRLEGLEHILKLVRARQGAVVVSGHIGPMEFMIQAIAGYGYPLIGITEHMKPERLHQYIIGLRSAHGLDLISTTGSLLDVYRRIKRGDILLSTADRDSTGTGVITDFFGAPAWLPDGYARLAVRANVPVVFGYSVDTGDAVEGRVYPPLYPDTSLGKEDAVVDLIRRTVQLLEEAIRANPAAWHLSTPIWQLAEQRLGKGLSR